MSLSPAHCAVQHLTGGLRRGCDEDQGDHVSDHKFQVLFELSAPFLIVLGELHQAWMVEIQLFSK